MGPTARAFDSSALAPGGKFSEAMKSIDHLVNLYNSRDPILRRFRFFDRQNEPVAAGFFLPGRAIRFHGQPTIGKRSAH